MAGEVRVAGDLPPGQVDGLEAGTDLLHGLVAGQGAQRVDVVHVVELLPQHLGAAAGQRALLDHVPLQSDDVLRGVRAGDALPARVVVPVVLDLFG